MARLTPTILIVASLLLGGLVACTDDDGPTGPGSDPTLLARGTLAPTAAP